MQLAECPLLIPEIGSVLYPHAMSWSTARLPPAVEDSFLPQFLFLQQHSEKILNPKQFIKLPFHPNHLQTANMSTVTLTLPEPFASIPKADFLFGPSPIHHLPRISEALGGKVSIWAKREDCNSGIAFGGNKTRKLEYVACYPTFRLVKNSILIILPRYLIPEALEQGCDTLISIGGVQSNHTRQVAGVAAKLGLKVRTYEPSREHLVSVPTKLTPPLSRPN